MMRHALVNVSSLKFVLLCLLGTIVLRDCEGKKLERKRKVTSLFNPGCNATLYPACGSEKTHQLSDGFVNLLYTTATAEQDSHDELHYVWSTRGGPAVLVVRSAEPGAKLLIDWKRFLSSKSDFYGSIGFSGLKEYFSYGIFFSRLIEYNDLHDSASIDSLNQSDTSLFRFHDLSKYRWHSALDQGSVDGDKVIFSVDEPDLMQNNGSLVFTVGVSDKDGGRGFELPFLDTTENTTHIDLEINDMKPSFNKSRFVIEVVLVTQHTTDKQLHIESHDSIDDEYSPGVFKVHTVRTNPDNELENAYIQWKPVAYFDKDRTLEVSTKTKNYGLQSLSAAEVSPNNILYAYYNHSLLDDKKGDLVVHTLNVSFGLTKDKFYNRENFTGWSMNLGYGKPPEDHISAVILIMISVGLGLPVVLIMFGGIGVCVKRYRQRSENSSAYSTIN